MSSTLDDPTSSSTTSTTTTTPSVPAVPLSRTALKRAAKKARFEAEKPARRAKEKAAKQVKLAEKRRLIELGLLEKPKPIRKGSEGYRPKRNWGTRIVVDMGFDEKMSEKEIKSMSGQLAYCYSANRSSPNPVTPLLITSLGGRVLNRLEIEGRGTYKSWKGVEWWSEGYESLWSTASTEETEPIQVGALKGKPKSRSRKEDVIYLTGDSPNVLSEIEEGKTYILGGIVDKNRYKHLCLNKAIEHGIQHAQLPIGEFLPEMTTRKILTVNQVFEIIVQWGEQRDWQKALRAVIPLRKFERERGQKKNLPRDGAHGEEGEEEEDGEEEEEEEGVEDVSMEVAGEEGEGEVEGDSGGGDKEDAVAEATIVASEEASQSEDAVASKEVAKSEEGPVA